MRFHCSQRHPGGMLQAVITNVYNKVEGRSGLQQYVTLVSTILLVHGYKLVSSYYLPLHSQRSVVHCPKGVQDGLPNCEHLYQDCRDYVAVYNQQGSITNCSRLVPYLP